MEHTILPLLSPTLGQVSAALKLTVSPAIGHDISVEVDVAVLLSLTAMKATELVSMVKFNNIMPMGVEREIKDLSK